MIFRSMLSEEIVGKHLSHSCPLNRRYCLQGIILTRTRYVAQALSYDAEGADNNLALVSPEFSYEKSTSQLQSFCGDDRLIR